MTFTSIQFWPFLLGVWLLHLICPLRYRWLVLLVGGYLFYGFTSWKFCLILAGVTTVSYVTALAMAAWPSRARRLLLAFGIMVGLTPLLIYKYADFLLGMLPASENHLLHLAVPVGISFFTLQSIGYIIDVYYGRLSAEKHAGRYALFTAFFPQMLAGPIERGGNMLPQYLAGGNISYERVASGLQLVVWGLFQKMVVGERLAIYVNKVYSDPSAYSAGTLLIAVYFYAFQIYCDFAGYSNMAIGTARILGYDLMQNFNLPYFAASITDFWKRWHISLTSWFRDYLYIPLGGNRVSQLRWIFNIMLVFVVSGLWHGANWTFIIWGAIHGGWYLLERTFAKPCAVIPAALRKPLGWIITFNVVVIAWIFFRAPTFGRALAVLRGIGAGGFCNIYRGPSQFTTLLSFVFMALMLAVEFAQYRGWASINGSASRFSMPARWGGTIALVILTAVFGISSSSFIYFQF